MQYSISNYLVFILVVLVFILSWKINERLRKKNLEKINMYKHKGMLAGFFSFIFLYISILIYNILTYQCFTPYPFSPCLSLVGYITFFMFFSLIGILIGSFLSSYIGSAVGYHFDKHKKQAPFFLLVFYIYLIEIAIFSFLSFLGYVSENYL